MKDKQEENIDEIVNELVRRYGIEDVLLSVVNACDSNADFAHLSNERVIEDYWRMIVIAIFDCIDRIKDLPKKNKRF